ncbi:MAG: EcsC family protein [Bacteroidetes bacterium]|nr:EcsC family protein [Bacteroidota bacterium]
MSNDPKLFSAEMSYDDFLELEKCVEIIEKPSFFIKVSNFIGSPIEKLVEKLPEGSRNKITDITNDALLKGTNLAVKTLEYVESNTEHDSKKIHKLVASVLGGGAGLFGFTALAIELPLTTTVMLRSIAEIAKMNGEDMSSLETRLNCVQVFAFGSKNKADDAMNSSYYAIRILLSREIAALAGRLEAHFAGELASGILGKFLGKITERFSQNVLIKFVGQATPIIGAAGGASINYLFTEFYQQIATAHFTIRRLERKYSPELIEAEYDRIAVRLKTKKED